MQERRPYLFGISVLGMTVNRTQRPGHDVKLYTVVTEAVLPTSTRSSVSGLFWMRLSHRLVADPRWKCLLTEHSTTLSTTTFTSRAPAATLNF